MDKVVEDEKLSDLFVKFLNKQNDCEHDFEIEHMYDGVCSYTVRKCKKCGLTATNNYRPSYME